MRPVDTDGVTWSVCLLVTFKSPAQTAERIKMSFGWVTQVGPIRNHTLDETPDPSGERAIFWGCPSHWKALWLTARVYTAKK